MTGPLRTAPADPPAALAQRIVFPFYVYAVLSNTLLQRGVFVLYLVHQGFSAAQIALLQTVLYLSSALAEIPTGILADRFGRRSSIVIGQFLSGLCVLGQILLPGGFPVFLGLFLLQGVAFACVSGAETALLYDLLRQRGLKTEYLRVKSRYAAFGATTMGLAIALGGFLQRFSWELVYSVSGCALILAAVLLLTRVPELRGAETDEAEDEGSHDPVPSRRGALMSILTPRLASLVIVSGLMHATTTPYFIFTQGSLSDQGAPTALVALVISVAYLVSGTTPLLAVRAAEWIPLRALVPLTVLALAAGLALTGVGNPWLTAGLFLLVIGVPDITAVVIDNVFNEAVPSRFRASLLSVITFIESALIGLGYLAMGWLIDRFGSSGGVAWYAAVPIAAFVLWLPALRKGRWTREDAVAR
ncbi:MFS transporter [Streptosporangium sp. NPDC023615]|uniref:MFS transporter n=1 Tax=Streptosporangium sp. NPDC023615 TaxID=3154794 RepID=UPI0034435FB0